MKRLAASARPTDSARWANGVALALWIALAFVAMGGCQVEATCFDCEGTPPGGGAGPGGGTTGECGPSVPCADPDETCCQGACIALRSDVNHCGACDRACGLTATATVECVDGACVMSCLPGQEDCNQVQTDGCEANLESDRFNCGECGNGCVVLHATSQCVGGECEIAACEEGFSNCDADDEPTDVVGCEIDIGTDPDNCNGCGEVCPGPPNRETLCLAGTCAVGLCTVGFGDCTGGDADGCETDLLSDAANCGLCGYGCPAYPRSAPACVAGTCGVGQCDAGFDDCDQSVWSGCETELASAKNHCGFCGHACLPVAQGQPACVDSDCVIGACAPGWADCFGGVADGCETDLSSAVDHCGVCDNVCPPIPNGTPGCQGYACGIGSCDPDFDDCYGGAADGCETDLLSSIFHCGGCGAPCAPVANGTRDCVLGQCAIGSCDLGFDDCVGGLADGCETNIDSSVTHCGSCGNACPVPPDGTAACRQGGCGLGDCLPGYANCDGDESNGCERSTQTDAGNCGGCGITCGSGSCVNGACVCNNNVLVIADDSAAGSATLAAALTSAGYTTTQTAVPSYQYNGTNPPLAAFGSVVLLAGGPNATSYGTDMPVAGQAAILSFVSGSGNGLVVTEWASFHVAAGRWQTLAPLVLLTRTAAYSGQVTYTVDGPFLTHPIWAGLNPSFTFATTSNVGTARIAPYVARAAGGTNIIDAVAVRDAPVGRVVHVAHAGNYAPNGWSNTNVQRLVANSVGWVARCQ